MTTGNHENKFAKLLAGLGIDQPGISVLLRNSLYDANKPAKVQEVDLTPRVFDPNIGGSGEAPRSCEESRSIDMGGRASTGDSGKLTWRLSNFVCKSDQGRYSEPVSFVATPLSANPVSLSALVRSVGSDLEVEVFSWDAAGAPAPHVSFSWRCWVQAGPDVDIL